MATQGLCIFCFCKETTNRIRDSSVPSCSAGHPLLSPAGWQRVLWLSCAFSVVFRPISFIFGVCQDKRGHMSPWGQHGGVSASGPLCTPRSRCQGRECRRRAMWGPTCRARLQEAPAYNPKKTKISQKSTFSSLCFPPPYSQSSLPISHRALPPAQPFPQLLSPRAAGRGICKLLLLLCACFLFSFFFPLFPPLLLFLLPLFFPSHGGCLPLSPPPPP